MISRTVLLALSLAILSGCSSSEKPPPTTATSGWRSEFWAWAKTRHPEWPKETWDNIKGENAQTLTPPQHEVYQVGWGSTSLESAKKELTRREEATGSRDRFWVDVKRDHPDWTEEQLQHMQSGEVWVGMTEEQFLVTMRDINPRTRWHISDSDDFRIYIDENTNDNFTFGQKAKTLKLWKINPR